MKRLLSIVFLIFSVIIVNAQDAAEKINQAQEALGNKDYAKAYELYDNAMNNLGDVQVPEAIYYNIGIAAYRSDNLEGAKKYLGKSIELGINVSKCNEYIARLYEDKEMYEEAVASFTQAIETSEEGSGDLYYLAAIAAYKGKMYDQAISYFDKCIEGNVRGETCVYYKANAFKSQGNDDGYKAALESGNEKYPGDKRIAPALAKIYFDEGYALYQKGAEVITAANAKVEAGDMSTADDAYKAEVEKGKESFRAAIPILEKAKELDPSNANVENVLSACNQSL
ncbi:MAG: tetratricopeptide repeat protein [Prolixibacteraceae bacterium]|nr:tetratricopeptide repeat protein [Prolixibacteraceae bacterium]MBN2774682.1 tetratricopeptide repeat protein [Prolixibacteraceae bacterium]